MLCSHREEEPSGKSEGPEARRCLAVGNSPGAVLTLGSEKGPGEGRGFGVALKGGCLLFGCWEQRGHSWLKKQPGVACDSSPCVCRAHR